MLFKIKQKIENRINIQKKYGFKRERTNDEQFLSGKIDFRTKILARQATVQQNIFLVDSRTLRTLSRILLWPEFNASRRTLCHQYLICSTAAEDATSLNTELGLQHFLHGLEPYCGQSCILEDASLFPVFCGCESLSETLYFLASGGPVWSILSVHY